jgi:hypothetical protein
MVDDVDEGGAAIGQLNPRVLDDLSGACRGAQVGVERHEMPVTI